MRAFRALAVFALVALPATGVSAQATRGFKDSWYWGLKGGGMVYQVQSDSMAFAPVAGVDWFITRTVGGLYVSFDQAFFSNNAVFVNDSVNPLYTGPRTVYLSNLRRLSVAGMLFPMQTYRLHPYVGFGATLNYIGSVKPQGTYVTPGGATQKALVDATVEQFRSNTTVLALAGAQLRLPALSLFAQVTAVPSTANFFLFTGTGVRATGEFGVRYNVGTSVDPMR